MIENIRLSVKGIMSHKMRSALTMLGIIIGIASIIMIVSIIQGTSDMLKEELVGRGTNTVTICFYDKDYSYEPYNTLYYGKLEGISDIPEESIDAINELDGVVACSTMYYNEYGFDIYYNDENMYGNTYGVDADFFAINDIQLEKGRLFTQSDYDNKNNVIILSSSTANSLFSGEECLGKTVTLGGELFVVVGVADSAVDYDSINNLSDYYTAVYSGYSYNSYYIPKTSWNLIAGYDDIQSLIIKAESADDTVSVGYAAAEILNQNVYNDQYEYKSTSLMEDAEELEMITNVISILLISIASISLLVGGIGVMNIMLVSVTERTREIGLKKALGAKKHRILAQFLTEAAALTSMGGILGVIIGTVLAYAVGFVFEMTISISIPAIVISVAFSMAVGLIFGIVPSVKAAKLDPIVALRYE